MGSIASNYNTSIIGTFLSDFAAAISTFVRSVKEHLSTARAERELRLLDDRLLADIGLNRSEITYVVRSGNGR